MTKTSTPSPLTTYDYSETHSENPPLERPLNVVFITSVRDVGAEDKNGSTITLPDGREVYMMGLIEAVNRIINDGRNDLSNCIRIRGIITDDHPKDRLNGYEIHPNDNEGLWIHPKDIRDDRGELLTKNTHNVPSTYRKISGKTNPERKQQAKLEFEEEAIAVSQQMGADIIVSDHLMLRLENMIAEYRHLFGKVLNIHPAMTRGDYSFNLRGKTPTADALSRLKGFKINENGIYEQTTPHYWTGGTLHIVDTEIDGGAVLADGEMTPVHPKYTAQQLRYENYSASKIPVFIHGIQHYVRNIFPNLHNNDFRSPAKQSCIIDTSTLTT
ncbi:MAG: formyltransferase family protein [Candidatus Gracilibacteria bacterium]|nr:formyltransferase family protein [Candidatus Gracilibacteria bacterium]